METKLEDKGYRELQKIAKEKVLKYVGVGRKDLIESIENFKEEVPSGDQNDAPRTNEEAVDKEALDAGEKMTDEEKAQAKKEAIPVEADASANKDEVKDAPVDNSAKTFQGKTIIDTNNKLVNGKSYKEIRVVSGETFLVTDEELEA